MAVFRVEKTKGYTVMSNHHLRNPDLTLKAKGLLSQMLSLPENWDYTLKGLSSINRESIDAIRTAVWELEKVGYITRRQGRDGQGKKNAREKLVRQAETDPAAAAELAKKRAYASEATKKSRQKMYEEAATGNPEAVERYENYLAARREAYHKKKQEAERTA